MTNGKPSRTLSEILNILNSATTDELKILTLDDLRELAKEYRELSRRMAESIEARCTKDLN